MKNSKISKTREENRKERLDEINKLFIKGMEENKLPWQKPWNGPDYRMDYNYFSMKDNGFYRGSNSILTELHRLINLGSSDPRWATFVNIEKYNETVKEEKEKLTIKKGEHALLLTKYKPIYYDKYNKKLTDEEAKQFPDKVANQKMIYSPFFVFNASQIGKYTYDKDGNKLKDENGNYIYREGLPPLVTEQMLNKDFKPLIEPEKIIKNTGVTIKYDQLNRCFYKPSVDTIHMVKPEQFHNTTEYYATLLHELIHWSGDARRLNREEASKYGDSLEWRAKEELVAEIGSYMLCKESRISFVPSQDNLSYVKSWSEYLKDKPEGLVEAIDKADKSKSFIIDLTNNPQRAKSNIVITKLENIQTRTKGRH